MPLPPFTAVAIPSFVGAVPLPTLRTVVAPRPRRSLRVDRAHSIAGFTVKHLFVAAVHGTMRLASVEMSLQRDSYLPATVTAVLDASSIDSGEPERDRDLRSRDWLDTVRYPSIVFTSRLVVPSHTPNQFRLYGDLELRGVRKVTSLDVTHVGDAVDEHGDHHYGYSATATIDRRDFGLAAGPAGQLLVGTAIALSIELDMVVSGESAA